MSISLSATPATGRKPAAPGGCVVKSAARVMRILEFFDRRRGAANLHTVAIALGYPASSTGALLRSLVATGYLHYDRNVRTYTPTLRVTLLGADWVAPRLMGNGPLQHLMTTLAERSGGTVALAARNGDHADFIHVVGPPREGMEVGGGRALISNCIGHALLAALPAKEVRGLLCRLNAAALDVGAPTLRAADLLEQLTQLRRTGYATSLEEGQLIVSATLPLHEQGGPYAIAAFVPASNLSPKPAELGRVVCEEMVRHLDVVGLLPRWPVGRVPLRAEMTRLHHRQAA